MNEGPPRKSSDGALLKVAGFVVMAIMAAGLVAGLSRGRTGRSSKSPIAKGSTPPRHVRGASRHEPEAVEPSARFEVHKEDKLEGGGVVVLGITENLSEVAVNPPKLRAIFRDDSGAEVHRDETRWPFDMGPGARVPTRLVYSSVPPYDSIEVEVLVSASVGLPAATGLSAEGVNAEPGQASWTLRGKAANRGKAPARWLKVVAAAYGPQNRLLWVGTRSLDGDSLEPGQSKPFSLRVFRDDLSAEDPRFEVQVFGRER